MRNSTLFERWRPITKGSRTKDQQRTRKLIVLLIGGAILEATGNGYLTVTEPADRPLSESEVASLKRKQS
jgi:hypothetical protein